jgi:hypothetical protein
VCESKFGEALVGSTEVAPSRFRYELLFSRLSFAPVASVKRLPESLTVNKEMRMPDPTAFYEGHLYLFFPSPSIPSSVAVNLYVATSCYSPDAHTGDCNTSFHGQSIVGKFCDIHDKEAAASDSTRRTKASISTRPTNPKGRTWV